jgi:hypothetical protein
MIEIESLLNNGISEEDILGILGKKIPGIQQKIKSALMEGYLPNQILKFFQLHGSKNKKADRLMGFSPSQQDASKLAAQSRPQDNIQRRLASLVGDVAPAVVGGLGALALGRAIPKAAKQLAPLIGKNTTASNQVNKISPIKSSIQDATGQFPVNVSNPEIVEALKNTVTEKDQVPSEKNLDIKAILDSHQLTDQIENLRQAGNSPENISTFIKTFMSDKLKGVEKSANLPFEQVVSEYFNQNPVKTPEQPIEENKLTEQPIEEEPQNEQKSTMVALSNGDVGNVESIKDGVAKINVDGQIKNRRESDLIESPLPEKSLGELYTELTDKIPEHARSGPINLAGYDPEHNELLFVPHSGALYVYSDIPQEFADKLKDAMFQAKTTGKNFYGAWTEGEASRGAGLSALIKDLQKKHGGKGKEYIRKYERIYDLFALPKEEIAAKQKEATQKRKEQRKNAKRKPKV